jgi:hypothetical protein
MSVTDLPTPAQLRELAEQAETLAAAVHEVKARLRAAPDRPTSQVAFRLDYAAGEMRAGAVAVRETAADLERVHDRSDCAAEWGVCPDHGDTLRSSGGVTWCEAPGCRHAWNHDRMALPCTEPVAYLVRDPHGTEMPLCVGHTIDARTVLPLETRYIPTTEGVRP